MSSPIETSRARVAFLLQQIESLEHYLPETYQMLMNELDQQQKILKQHEIHAFYQQQSYEQQNKTVDSADQIQAEKHLDSAITLQQLSLKPI